jgi:hypothetical protein
MHILGTVKTLYVVNIVVLVHTVEAKKSRSQKTGKDEMLGSHDVILAGFPLFSILMLFKSPPSMKWAAWFYWL